MPISDKTKRLDIMAMRNHAAWCGRIRHVGKLEMREYAGYKDVPASKKYIHFHDTVLPRNCSPPPSCVFAKCKA